MKKIVALVLSLVMVLGLATTAFAAKTTTYEGLYGTDTNSLDTFDDATFTITVNPAVAPVYNTDGTLKTAGKIETVDAVCTIQVSGVGAVQVYGATCRFVDTLGEADLVLYKDVARKQVMFYLDALDFNGVYKEGVPFANFGKECGQTTYVADADTKYYTIKGLAFGVYAEDEASTDYLMVAGKLVPVTFVTNHVVEHTAVYTNKDGKTVAVECGKCGLDAVQAPNMLSVPKGIVPFAGLGNTVWYWPTAAAAPVVDTDKVESAETFDAGIAMYVGMSVMAAAGSAVVLKKKD